MRQNFVDSGLPWSCFSAYSLLADSEVEGGHFELTSLLSLVHNLIYTRCCIIVLLLHLTGKVSLQDSANIFERFVGDSVTLPCLYENKQSNVLWRHNVSRRVLNIINDKLTLENQDTIFQNRTESFSSEYPKGNYSIMLKNVELIHAGNYTCFIQKSNEEKKLQLFVKEKPEKNIQKPGNSSMDAQSQKIMAFLIALLGLTLHHI